MTDGSGRVTKGRRRRRAGVGLRCFRGGGMTVPRALSSTKQPTTLFKTYDWHSPIAPVVRLAQKMLLMVKVFGRETLFRRGQNECYWYFFKCKQI